jgi:hypothetical protein
MKFTDLTIDQFQRIAAIEMTADEATRKVAIYAVVKGITLEEAQKMSIGKIIWEHKKIESQLKDIPPIAYKERMKVNGKQYKLTLFTDKLSAGQLLELLGYNLTNDYEVIQSLHNVMATLARERKWWRTLPYDGAGHAARAEEFKKHCTMGQVWGAASFFLMASESFWKIIPKYLEAMMKTTVKA